MSDPILFEVLVGATSYGEGASSVFAESFGSDADSFGYSVGNLLSSGLGPDLGPLSLGEGASYLRVETLGADGDIGRSDGALTTFGRSFDITPDIAVGVSSTALWELSATSYSVDFYEGASELFKTRTFGSDADDVGFSYSRLFTSLGNDVPPPVADNFILLFQTSGWLKITAGFPFNEAHDEGIVSDFAESTLTISARDTGDIRALTLSNLTGVQTLVERVLAADVSAVIIDLVASAEATASDSAEGFLQLLLEAADFAVATGISDSTLDALCMVAALADAEDVASVILDAGVSAEGAVLDAAAIERIGLLVEALSSGELTDSATNALSFVASVSDIGALEAAPLASLTALAQAFDEGLAVGIARILGEAYAMYAMTLEGAAPSEYEGVGYDSVTTIGGIAYGVNESGFHRLDGDTDNGAPINAYVQPGFSSLGTLLKKQVSSAYVGLTSDGTMLLKASTTEDGVKRTRVYKLNPVARDTVRNGRISMAKGRHSVYWNFELANSEGCDFELDVIKVWRLPLNRRK